VDAGSLSPVKILIVEDELPLLRLITRVVEKAGYQTFSASNGREALEIFHGNHAEIEAAILDINIPPNGVTEILDGILDTRPDLAVVVTSGGVPGPEVNRLLARCGGEFLGKPFVPNALLSSLETSIERARSTPSAGNGAEEGS
jgi:DNA-binding NtrC family response regulator